MKKIWMIMGCSLLLAACGDPDKEATSIETPVAESENESTQVTEPMDENYAAFLEHHSEKELEDLRQNGEKLIYAFYSQLDEQIYSEVKDSLEKRVQTLLESQVRSLDSSKEYKVEKISSEYVQGFDAPEVHILYSVDYYEVNKEAQSELKTNEFKVIGLGYRDKDGLGINEFQNKTILDENSLFN